MIVSQEKIKEFIKEQHAIDGMVSIHDFELWLEEQPKVGEWIPVSEREPEEPEDGFKRYIVQRASNAEPRSLYWDQYGTWLDEEGTPYTDIIAWMPLPEPYKESE